MYTCIGDRKLNHQLLQYEEENDNNKVYDVYITITMLSDTEDLSWVVMSYKPAT